MSRGHLNWSVAVLGKCKNIHMVACLLSREKLTMNCGSQCVVEGREGAMKHSNLLTAECFLSLL